MDDTGDPGPLTCPLHDPQDLYITLFHFAGGYLLLYVIGDKYSDRSWFYL